MDTKKEHRTHAERLPRRNPYGFAYSPSGREPLHLQEKADVLFDQSREQIRKRELDKNDLYCVVNSNDYARPEFIKEIEGIPYSMHADVEFVNNRLKEIIHELIEVHHEETDVFFYHSDHLGSASWITERHGGAVQHLQYLPYGERYIDQRTSGYHERFIFTGKGRDEETGFGYFGARYMDYELMTMWISFDLLADKYPSVSPYAYCAWSPVKLVNLDGVHGVQDWTLQTHRGCPNHPSCG